MIIPIKQALLEGYTLEAIVEAVHANHPQLDKKLLKNPKTSYLKGKQIEQNRENLAKDIRELRRIRDWKRKESTEGKGHSDLVKKAAQEGANFLDNEARTRSQTGVANMSSTPAEAQGLTYRKLSNVVENVPRFISSARQ